MKRLLVAIGVVLQFAVVMAGLSSVASATACAPTTDYGTVTYTVPTLPATGNYYIWSRLNVPDTSNNSYYIEVDFGATKTCYKAGDSSSITPNAWRWVNYQNGNGTSTIQYNFTQTNGYSIKMMGAEPNVKLDKVMLIPGTCIPADSGFGDDCGNAVTPTPGGGTTGGGTTDGGPIVVVVPPTTDPVKGPVNTSPTVVSAPDSIAKVEYYSDGRLVQTSNGAKPLDTTLLTNGQHTVDAKITFKDGTKRTEQTTLTVNNPQSIYTPVVRWMRLNKHALTLVSASVATLSFCLAVFFVAKYLYTQHRLMKFHGF